MNSLKKHTLAAALLLFALASQAASLQNTTGLAGATDTITFSEVALTAGTTVTNQYAAYGATFTPFAVFRPQDGFFGTDYLGNFGSPGVANPLEIVFSHVVSGAAFQDISNAGTTTFEALLGGNVVETFSASTSTATGTFYGFDGIAFDTIRVTSPVNGAMELDTLEFSPSAVPEPAPIALFGLGLAALAIWTRRKA